MRSHGTWWRRFFQLYASRHEPEAMRPLGTIVWRGMLVLFLIGVIIAVIYASTVFTFVVDKVNTVPPLTTPETALDRNALDQTIREIRAQKGILNVQ